jgi:hypothetical protein
MNRNYGKLILDAKRLLASGVYEDAADCAMKAMDVAMYGMMEPVTSQYVQSAKAIRDEAFRSIRA